ncbi:hypothetical protein MJA45_19700 [Paenibacillus aurantius]|uniref:Uncharacterized protein n=1 Tax=Paenibacillus aurantius TaxID=2918900 RepID=A0AA96RBV8_9BACL|nr:hypothetical protein [Paenibacillus aurantius]WJH34616.1 hypothetical protein N6H14_33485 [Paenibacillus sp. CC-CFT747]WNQ09835.1 hypothetical protein MJA45_19700 [Paenibacillus aurantius]
MNSGYEFTNMDQDGELVQEIVKLEAKMQQKLGREVNLIAYSPTNGKEDSADSSTGTCRPGLSE